MQKKTRKSILVLSSLMLLTSAAISVSNMYTTNAQNVLAEETPGVLEEDLKQAEIAKNNLYINSDLENIVADIYLPDKGLYDARITWESSNTSVISIRSKRGAVARQNEDVKVTLTATIIVKTASVQKTFECKVLAKTTNTFVREVGFYDNFSNYKTNQDLSNYYIWELKNGDEIAKVREAVENNEMVKLKPEDKVLEIEPLPTLYKDSIYQTKVALENEMVFETYVMSQGESSGFQIEFGTGSSSKLVIGMIDGNFVTGKDKVDENGNIVSQATRVPFDEGVWYKLRVEMNLTSKKFHAYYYDFYDNSKLVEITKSSGESCDGLTAGQNNYFKMRVLTGRHNCKFYVSNVNLNSKTKFVGTSNANPNRELGIGVIDNFTSSYLLVEGEEFTIPELVIHNRFGNDKRVLIEGTDYLLEKTYGPSGELNLLSPGHYSIHYKISLLNNGQVYEVKELDQTFYVDAKDGIAQLSTLRIAPIVRDTDETYVNKKIKLSANINRKDSTVYYAAVETGNNPLTSDEVINGSYSIKGSIKVEEASFSIEIEGLDSNKEYDFYVVTKNDNGYSEVPYSKKKVSIKVYNIEDAEDFFFMCTDPEVQTTNFRLLNDIDFSNYYWAASEITRPAYVGTFDGQGHTISNLHITAPYKRASLFYQFAGTFKNLNFENCVLEGHESVGFIGGYGAGGAHVSNITMRNCVVRCDDILYGGDGYYGLIFGRAEGGTKYGGAIIEKVDIANCSVEGPKYLGALVGNIQKMDQVTISDVYCQVSLKSDGAKLGLVSRARAPLTFKNIVADLKVIYAKKEVGLLCGGIESTHVQAENVVGRLSVMGLTQPTYFNNVTGAYSKSEGTLFSYKNIAFFEIDTSSLGEDTVTPAASTLSCGKIIQDEMGTTKDWWEMNTWLKDLDTNPNWKFDEKLKRPVMEIRDMSKLSFTADQVNKYIDQIEKINSKTAFYIAKAQELLKYTSNEEKAKVHMDKLNEAIQKYNEYCALTESVIGVGNSTSNGVVSPIEWTFTPKGGN